MTVKHHGPAWVTAIIALTVTPPNALFASPGGTVAYVDDSADPEGDGISWETAFDDLQDALDAAVAAQGAVTEIWVAAGSYRPSVRVDPDEPQTVAFQLLSGVAIYGGFAGDETDLSQRDPSVNFTVLSGDVGQPGGHYDDAHHVIVAAGTDATAVLDGFVITGGRADHACHNYDELGAGLHTFGGSPSIIGCVFSDNFAERGGGAVYVQGGSPSFTACTFSGNDAEPGGGAIVNSGTLELVDCDFTLNTADRGGAVVNYGSVSMTGCTFLLNTALVEDGGAINSDEESEATLVNCLFVANSAVSRGGGVFTNAGPGFTVSLTDCTFSGNEAFDGAGLYAQQTSPELDGCLFADNDAGRHGSGIFVDGGDLSVLDCTFDHNWSTWSGAGLFITGGGTLDVQGCTFRDNRAFDFYGGGIYNNGCSALLADSMFRNNLADDYGAAVYNTNGAVSTIQGCTFEGNLVAFGALASEDSTVTVTGCSFVDNQGAAGAALLNTGSTVATVSDCLFTGNTTTGSASAVSNEMTSQSSFTDCTFVGNTAPDGGTMRCFGDGATALERCYFVHNGGGGIKCWNEITVTSCTFIGNTSVNAGAIDIDNPGLATVSDCTFTGNSATGSAGAISGDANVIRCTFERNIAGTHSGAIKAGEGSIIDCVFTDNSAQTTGGAMAISRDEPLVVGCVFSGNSANRGGAVDIDPGSGSGDMPTFINCSFVGNSAITDGGALYSYRANTFPALTNCLFSGNSCGGNGGAIHNDTSSPTLVNCTVAGNTAGGNGGGMYSYVQTPPVVGNSIFWANTDSAGSVESSQVFDDNGSTTVNYSCIQGLTGGLGGLGNISDDPLFVDADGPDDVTGTGDDDLRLLSGSPCTDAAENAAVPADSADLDDDGDVLEPVPVDLGGRQRFVDDPDVVDTGAGDPPVVDLGAYEFPADQCPADVDGDGTVGVLDFLALLAAWGTDPGGPPDLDGDHDVGVIDLLILLAAWGPCP
ncbi:MAG: right-handed parallel beta-helix repeat-containing protein [Planctomycetota bacterium]|jgi:predicted outer membrane repeat protein